MLEVFELCQGGAQVTALTAVLLGAIAAILGGVLSGVLSGAYQHWRDRRERPKLQLDYQGIDGINKVDSDVPINGNLESLIYIRARVTNAGLRVAKNCRVYLTALKEVHPSGLTATSYHDAMPLAWPGWDFLPRDVPRGVDFYFDLMWVSKSVAGWKISVEKLYGSHTNLQNYSGTYRFTLLATAENALPVECQVDVTYNQNWNNLRAVAVPARSN